MKRYSARLSLLSAPRSGFFPSEIKRIAPEWNGQPDFERERRLRLSRRRQAVREMRRLRSEAVREGMALRPLDEIVATVRARRDS